MPHTQHVDERKRSSGPKGKFMDVFRRVALGGRRASAEEVCPPAERPTRPESVRSKSSPRTGESTPRLVHKSSSIDSFATSPPSSRRSSVLQPPPERKLDSTTPASELPKTWEEWNYAYQHGLIDFNDPPPPPSDLRSSEFATRTGQFRAPMPANEARRQRAVDSVGLSRDLASPPPYRVDSDPASSGQRPDSLQTKRQEGPLYPALAQLAKEAKSRFGVDASTISLMDRDKQVFLADDACRFIEEVDAIPRELTCCSHAMLKASTGTKDPLVILDFAKDWRFQQNGFEPYSEGFYAAAPIMLPAPMGDDETAYPGGIFCLLGEQPKNGFSEADRRELQEMADRASSEILQYAAQQRQHKRAELGKKRQEWKKSKLVHKASSQVQSLDQVVEIPTPPRTPELSGPLEVGDADEDELFAKADEENGDGPRRPSLVESVGSDRSLSDLVTTSTSPVFRSRRAGRPGVLATLSEPVSGEAQSVLDVTTQLVANSIEMDFAYVVAVDIASAKSGSAYSGASTACPALRLISTYGLPDPAPLFSVESHLDLLETKKHSAVLFTDDGAGTAAGTGAGASGDFNTGLVVKIGLDKEARVGYLLGCFSEDARRVVNAEDLQFVRSFARDLRNYVGPALA